MPFKGHDVKDWTHYKTPRTISDFHPDEENTVNVDRIVFWACVFILVLILTGAI